MATITFANAWDSIGPLNVLVGAKVSIKTARRLLKLIEFLETSVFTKTQKYKDSLAAHLGKPVEGNEEKKWILLPDAAQKYRKEIETYLTREVTVPFNLLFDDDDFGEVAISANELRSIQYMFKNNQTVTPKSNEKPPVPETQEQTDALKQKIALMQETEKTETG